MAEWKCTANAEARKVRFLTASPARKGIMFTPQSLRFCFKKTDFYPFTGFYPAER